MVRNILSTNPVFLFIDLFIYSYDGDFSQRPCPNNEKYQHLTLTVRFDMKQMNNSKFSVYHDRINHIELDEIIIS